MGSGLDFKARFVKIRDWSVVAPLRPGSGDSDCKVASHASHALAYKYVLQLRPPVVRCQGNNFNHCARMES